METSSVEKIRIYNLLMRLLRPSIYSIIIMVKYFELRLILGNASDVRSVDQFFLASFVKYHLMQSSTINIYVYLLRIERYSCKTALNCLLISHPVFFSFWSFYFSLNFLQLNIYWSFNWLRTYFYLTAHIKFDVKRKSSSFSKRMLYFPVS